MRAGSRPAEPDRSKRVCDKEQGVAGKGSGLEESMTVRSPLGLALSMAIVAFVAAAVGGPSAAATKKGGVDPAPSSARLKRTARAGR